jgi:SAM-dependent methyltransferase
MKVRESGMPERDIWEKIVVPQKILIQMELDSQVRDVVEVGCGYGTFTVPVAKVISGQIHAYDIDEEMVRITQAEARKAKLNNVDVVLRDIIADGTGLPDESVDYVMLFNIHWNYDPTTPRGPSMEIRPKPEACIRWAEQAGFHAAKRFDLKPYHYGIVLTR